MVISSLARKPFSSRDALSSACKLITQQIRHGSNRPNLQRPLPIHFNRARMLAVCEPVYPPKPKNCARDAMIDKKVDNPVADNPYGVFLAGQMRRDIIAHPLVVVLHCNTYTQHEMINIKGSLYDMKYDMKIRQSINYNVARLALTGTRWSPLIHLLKSNSAMGFCASDNIADLQKALKKMPQFVLVGAVVHERILHKEALEELARLRDIANVRSQLASTLAIQSVTLSQNLTANVNALSQSLNTHAKGGGDEDTSSSSSSDSDSDGSSSDSDSDKEKK